MAIYTKTGDKGTTALFGGKRVSKADAQIEAYGTVDELTSYLGLISVLDIDEREFIIQIQGDLYKIMAVLANANSPIEVVSDRITLFEQKIDLIESQLPKLTRFILPGGTELSSHYHIARTICRRTERRLVEFAQQSEQFSNDTMLLCIKYLNRLSDLFFDMARWYNREGELRT